MFSDFSPNEPNTQCEHVRIRLVTTCLCVEQNAPNIFHQQSVNEVRSKARICSLVRTQYRQFGVFVRFRPFAVKMSELTEWDRDKCLELIDQYEKYPVLWNPKHGLYYISKSAAVMRVKFFKCPLSMFLSNALFSRLENSQGMNQKKCTSSHYNVIHVSNLRESWKCSGNTANASKTGIICADRLFCLFVPTLRVWFVRTKMFRSGPTF